MNCLKICPKCGTHNSEAKNNCTRCKTPLPASEPPRKFCSVCQRVFPYTAQECDRCHIPLNSYAYLEPQPEGEKPDRIPNWIYVILILFPMLSFVLSFIYINRGWVKMGRRIMTLSVVMIIAQAVAGVLISAGIS